MLKKSDPRFSNLEDFEVNKVINLNEKKHKLIFEVLSDLLSNLAQNPWLGINLEKVKVNRFAELV